MPSAVASLDALGLPPVLRQLAMLQNGLVLAVGAAGSGKTTTIASMLDHRNQTAAGHILTIEDPIEYLHVHKRSLVTQREELERRVDDLRAFEREYRSRLKAYLEGQLRDLEAGVTDSGTFPAMPPTAPPAPPQLPAGLGQNSLRSGSTGPAPTAAQYAIPEHVGGFRPDGR